MEILLEERFDVRAAGTIIRWLRDEDILDEDVLLDLNPRDDCPSSWPLGWKIILHKIIDELKRSRTVNHNDNSATRQDDNAAVQSTNVMNDIGSEIDSAP